jgi:hypothetical protein
MGKEYQYAAKLQAQIIDMFSEESENYINKEEFLDQENATAFIHALANLVPALLYNQLTGESQDLLGVNHIANRLCHQFANNPVTP